jgi:diguanylate cyclase (GGDEF)-like protein
MVEINKLNPVYANMANISSGSDLSGDSFCDASACTCRHEIQSLREQIQILTEQVRTDALTGLFNFRFLMETIDLEMERTRRGTQPLGMILLDIDFFKKFNDKWGHEVGNLALVHIANLIKVAVRKLDFPCRFGGEEFIILLPNTDLSQAINVAERLREMIATTPLVLLSGESVTITASLGVDLFTSQNSESPEAFIHRVDAWLYKAKASGRNMSCFPLKVPMGAGESVTSEEKQALFGVFNLSE